MKKTKQIIALLLCLVMVVAGSVFATVAYLTSQATVENTFTVGQISIDLTEADVDKDGKPIEGAERVHANDYHLIPGSSYTKDPTVTIAEKSEESYIRMVVTLNKMDKLKDIFGDDFLPQEFVAGWDAEIWPCVAVVDHGDNTASYEFHYYTTVAGNEEGKGAKVLEPLFTEINMPGTITGEQLSTLEGFKINVVAHAIQRANLNTPAEAWAAFDAQYANP